MENLKKKIKTIPHSPGCYKYYNNKGELIYIGKAKDLRKRVNSYFKGRFTPTSNVGESPTLEVGALDSKTRVLVENIVDIKWEVTDSEIEALVLESLLIKKYKPRFNIKTKDDKDFLWVKIDMGQEYPQPELVRPIKLPLRGFDGVNHNKIKYFGPFTDPKLLKAGLGVLRKIFLWRDCSNAKFSFYQKKGKPCLEYYIKNCSAPCQFKVNDPRFAEASRGTYQLGIKQLVSFLKGGKKGLVKIFEREMVKLAKSKRFEEAAKVRDKLRSLQHMDASLKSQIANDKKYLISNIRYLKNFIKRLNDDLGYNIRFKKDFRIEFYDISNISGQEATGSMIVWKGNHFNKNEYRKFKIKFIKGPNDVGMMREVLFRRARYLKSQISNLKTTSQISNLKFEDPDLIVLDGGKPQLSGVGELFQQLDIKIPLISLAKQEEEVWGISYKVHKVVKFIKLNIAKDAPEGFFIQRLRDEAHRFAIGYHKVLREKKMVASRLDSIEGIGSKAKKKLLLKFGSVEGIIRARLDEIEKVVGKKMARKVKEGL